jgi:hypothetical protein
MEVVPGVRVVVLSTVAARVVSWDWNRVRNTKSVPGSGKENDDDIRTYPTVFELLLRSCTNEYIDFSVLYR